MDAQSKNNQAVDRRKTKRKSSIVDIYAGKRLRLRRKTLKLSQSQLATAIDMTCQQIQKYERGANRISTGTLFRLAQILDVTLDYFVEGFEDYNSTDFQGVEHKLLDHKDWQVITLYLECKKSEPETAHVAHQVLKLWLNR